MLKRAIATMAVLALCLVFLTACQPKKTSTPTAAGTAVEGGGTPAGPSPDFKLVDASSFKVNDYKGKVLLMDFWATWCGPCKQEIPHLIELQNKYRDQGLVVVGITMDNNPDQDVPKYAAEVGMNYTNVKGNDQLKSEYGVIGLPTIVIYDKNGNKVFSRPGYIEKDILEKEIQPLLAPTPPSN